MKINWYAVIIISVWICCSAVAIAVKDTEGEWAKAAFWMSLFIGVGYFLNH